MKSIRINLFILLYFVTFHCFGQDTLKYCNNSHYVSDCYYFYKSDKTASIGFFEKYMDSDDGQHWYGSGRFRETKTQIMLDSFKSVRTMYQYKSDSRVIKDNSVSDTTFIKNMVLYKKDRNLIYSLLDGNKKVYLASKNVLRPKYSGN